MKLKTKIILVLIIALLVFGYWGGRYLWGWYQVRQLLEFHEAELALLKSDTIGGDTPEQTWQMFLEALRQEDLDSASKYFVSKKQEEWRENFIKTKEAGDLPALIQEITIAPWQVVSPGEFLAEYEIKNAEGEITAYIIMEKNINNKWKISSF